MNSASSDDNSTKSGLLIIIAAPSGAGKTTLVEALVENDANIQFSISHTTRTKRPKEVDGDNYHFISQSTFAAMVTAGEFLEHAEVFGNSYGTAHQSITVPLAAGKDIILEIDWQGAAQVRAQFPESLSVFILPPSKAALLDRLRGRGQDNETVIQDRMNKAISEMSHWAEFDYVIVNDDLKKAIADLTSIVTSQRLRTIQQKFTLHELIDELLPDL
jgi:guanylate kinase